MAGPGIPAGERRAAQCYLRDLFPTICDLTGIAVPDVDGRSLEPVLRDKMDAIYPFIIGYFQDSQRMVREGDWKLIWYPKIDRWQLFNVATDPQELSDVIDEAAHREKMADLRGKLLRWLKDKGDPIATSKY